MLHAPSAVAGPKDTPSEDVLEVTYAPGVNSAPLTSEGGFEK